MPQYTITEGLADIKTIGKRIASKQQYVAQYIARMEKMRDPLEKDGGSATALQREIQAIGDLSERVIGIRRAIQEANRATTVTIAGQARSITDWLTWRREVAPTRQGFLKGLAAGIQQVRKEAQQKGYTIAAAAAQATVVQGDATPPDVVVNVDEPWIAAESEKLEQQLGELDGQLSLKNATTMITVPD